MSDGTHIKVLIIEDDPLMSRMYQRVLTFEGFEVVLAENGQAGLASLTEFHPDIILLDMMMPVMNGKETLAQLKANPATQAIPVIMLTNLTDPRAADEVLAGGALQYIIKSKYSPTDVAALLRDTLKKPAEPQADTQAQAQPQASAAQAETPAQPQTETPSETPAPAPAPAPQAEA